MKNFDDASLVWQRNLRQALAVLEEAAGAPHSLRFVGVLRKGSDLSPVVGHRLSIQSKVPTRPFLTQLYSITVRWSLVST